MGYSTRYELEYDRDKPSSVRCPQCLGSGKIAMKVKDAIEAKGLHGDENWSINSNLNEPCKWYSHEDDMLELSRRFPTVLFTLKGAGEDPGDLWVKYFKGGKMRVEKLVLQLPPFDEKKLAAVKKN